MSFLKGKNAAGEQTLIAVSQIESVVVSGEGVTVELKSGASVDLQLGFQAVTNRLKELGSDIA